MDPDSQAYGKILDGELSLKHGDANRLSLSRHAERKSSKRPPRPIRRFRFRLESLENADHEGVPGIWRTAWRCPDLQPRRLGIAWGLRTDLRYRTHYAR